MRDYLEELEPKLIRLKDHSPIKYMREKSFNRKNKSFSSNKIKMICEDYNGGYIEKRQPARSSNASVIEDYTSKYLNRSIWVRNHKKKQEAK